MRLCIGSCLFCMLAALCAAPAQETGPEVRETFFLCPEPLPRFGSSFFASLAQAELPEDIIQVDATFRAPLLTFSGRLGLTGPLRLGAEVKYYGIHKIKDGNLVLQAAVAFDLLRY